MFIHRAGDVIPEIVSPVYPNIDYEDYSIYKILNGTCPSCGSLIEREEDKVGWRCIGGWKCREQLIASVLHFCSRGALNIKGMGDVIVRELVTTGLINKLSDIYTLTKDSLMTIPLVGELTANNLISEIEKSKQPDESKLLYAIGVPGYGLVNSSKAVEEYGGIGEFVLNCKHLSKAAKAFFKR